MISNRRAPGQPMIGDSDTPAENAKGAGRLSVDGLVKCLTVDENPCNYEPATAR